MNLLVIGASRGIGFELVRQGLAAGHYVTVVVRNPARLPLRHRHLRIITGDIRDAHAVGSAMEAQDAVCITIGINPTLRRVSVFSKGTENVIKAMKEQGVKRLIGVTGIGAGDSARHGGLLYDKLVKPLLLGTIYDDKNCQEKLISESGLEWIIVRPGFLTNGSKTGEYRILTHLDNEKAGKISRADVADFILQQAAQMRYKGQTPLLTY